MLEQVIATRRDLGRGRLRRWLTGRPDPFLFRRPFAVAWEGSSLLVTDPGAGTVLRIDGRGRLSSSPGRLFESPIGVVVCRGGIMVSDSKAGKVARLDERLGLEGWVAESLDRPTGLACDGDRLFVVETGRHRVLALEPRATDASGQPEHESETHSGWGTTAPRSGSREAPRVDPELAVRVLGSRGEGSGEFNFPTLIALRSGSLWVGDTLNFRLQVFDSQSGRYLADFGDLGDAPGQMPRLKGLAVDGADRVWITDGHLDQIAIYGADGRFLGAIGGRGANPGEFSFPAGIAAHPDGRVAVVDSLNRRVQVFRLQPGKPSAEAR